MRFPATIILFCLFPAAFPGCADRVDNEFHRQELLNLNKKMRIAHLEGDAETIISSHAYPYVAVKNGQVSRPSPEDHAARFNSYMASMDVTAWDDLIEPIVVISDDASLATVIYRKHLSMVPTSQPDSEPYEGIYVWQSTYRRTAEGWKQISDILTALPENETIEELKALNSR